MDVMGGDWQWMMKSVSEIQTILRIRHHNGRPIGCETTGKKVYSSPCGLGWRFAIAFDSHPPEVDVFFDLHTAGQKLQPSDVLQVSVALISEEKAPVSGSQTEDRLLPVSGPSPVRLKSWLPANIMAKPFLFARVTAPNIKKLGETAAADSNERVQLLNQTLLGSLDGASFVDTKFVLFSRRSSVLGEVNSPVTLFANATLLSARSKYFETLLRNNGFLEAALVDLGDEVPDDMHLRLADYEYESDSDLEEEEECDITRRGTTSSQSFGSDMMKPMVYRGQKGRVVHIKDAAYKTMRSLLFYLYTGNFAFLPLRSARPEISVTPDIPKRIPSCSPKSMYRLADKLGLEELERPALEAIRASLNQHNIVEEVFSVFTSRYQKVKELEIDVLCDHFHTPEVSSGLRNFSAKLTSGELQHSSDILATLFGRLVVRKDS
ncbi:hypothetical protein JAAARDRAFT_35395 [Jaapia argillacea MUCL 33604]|uniref:BTB domain-containing protein n=1 Tax=Jaapia argillacea MUCL 33604 TaxID=933084 RepID=A0A067PSJ0_9AGAM|nr:hypothetical protein JAAARDRAFT_35395 [Jaapia argillacea MUCL 33604]